MIKDPTVKEMIKGMILFAIIAFIILVAVISILACCPGACHAGVVDSIKGWVTGNALNAIIAAIFVLIGGLAGGTKLGMIILKAKLPIIELKDVALRVHSARRPNSPGGKTITVEEKDAILAEVEELLRSLITVFGGKTT